jgi:hypothetical protein
MCQRPKYQSKQGQSYRTPDVQPRIPRFVSRRPITTTTPTTTPTPTTPTTRQTRNTTSKVITGRFIV